MRGSHLSFDHLLIRDAEGERRVDAADLPLRVGTGGDSSLRLPGPGSGPVVLLDLLDGQPFVQPVGGDTTLQINGEPLQTSQRLQQGDTFEFFGSRVLIAKSDDSLVLEVHLEDSAYVTQPPVQKSAETLAAQEQIAPTAFRRASETQAKLRRVATEPTQDNHRRGVGGVTNSVVSLVHFQVDSIRHRSRRSGQCEDCRWLVSIPDR